jgi:isopenicillin N synthase-like dioxygenase
VSIHWVFASWTTLRQMLTRFVHRFFEQPVENKEPIRVEKSKFGNNGWRAPRSYQVSPGEGLDVKEGFGWSYTPEYDPLYQGEDALSPEEVEARSTDEAKIWEATAHLENFKHDTVTYWQSCLNLARKFQKIIALSLDLPENHFDSATTFPGADGVYNYYPALTPEQQQKKVPDVGLGSHTDFQCFTLLWQDMSGGLQVLNGDNEWIWASPIEGTIVVNISDFLSRLTNKQYKSSVHRAYNRGLNDKYRISMPFFFGMCLVWGEVYIETELTVVVAGRF